MEQHTGLRPPAAKGKRGKGKAVPRWRSPVSLQRCAHLVDRAAEVAAVLTNEPHRGADRDRRHDPRSGAARAQVRYATSRSDGAGDGLHQRHHCEDLFRSASGPAGPDPARSVPSHPDPFRTEALRPDAGTDFPDVEQTTVAPAVEGTAVVPQTDFTPPLDIPAGGTDGPAR
jgi:hypothetical protein